MVYVFEDGDPESPTTVRAPLFYKEDQASIDLYIKKNRATEGGGRDCSPIRIHGDSAPPLSGEEPYGDIACGCGPDSGFWTRDALVGALERRLP